MKYWICLTFFIFGLVSVMGDIRKAKPFYDGDKQYIMCPHCGKMIWVHDEVIEFEGKGEFKIYNGGAR